MSSSDGEATRLVFAIDEAYSLPLTVAWHSLRVSNSELTDRLTIDVLYEELSPPTIERLRWHAELLGLRVRLRPVRLEPIRYPTAFGGAQANYLRLVIPELYLDGERILYLDADLVVRGDLRALLDTGLDGRPIAAVRDPLNPVVGRGRALPGWSKLGIPPEQEYFNSGVLLIDPARCREERLFARAVEFIAAHPEHIRLWDQDALNWAAADRWQRLDPHRNAFPLSALVRTPWVSYTTEDLMPLQDLVRLEETAAVLHFASPAKPWKNLLPDGPAADAYRALLSAVRDAELGVHRHGLNADPPRLHPRPTTPNQTGGH
ncbi:glycosyltransferase family 8 protein [Kitasatospora purpeofusca]|uniref:Glycosyltransferase family 8 protein n=1 Tax=Kitasatospora purpeofusca TaxID=67352 RepID=A0ABZ1UBI4_9ACTN|nr:glycosyltransferase family 8 protein [Kitasatospora purpeofusca]